jgi:hypothetical protein
LLFVTRERGFTLRIERAAKLRKEGVVHEGSVPDWLRDARKQTPVDCSTGVSVYLCKLVARLALCGGDMIGHRTAQGAGLLY